MKNYKYTFFIFIASLIIGFLGSINWTIDSMSSLFKMNAQEYKNASEERNMLYESISDLKEENYNLKEQYNSYINDISHIVFPIHDTGEIINDTKSIGNVSREVNFTSGDADSDTSSFRWCIYRGEYDYEAARKAAKKMSEILNKVNNTVYILVDDSNSNKAYSYMEKQGLLCGENARKLYSISNPK